MAPLMAGTKRFKFQTTITNAPDPTKESFWYLPRGRIVIVLLSLHPCRRRGSNRKDLPLSLILELQLELPLQLLHILRPIILAPLFALLSLILLFSHLLGPLSLLILLLLLFFFFFFALLLLLLLVILRSLLLEPPPFAFLSSVLLPSFFFATSSSSISLVLRLPFLSRLVSLLRRRPVACGVAAGFASLALLSTLALTRFGRPGDAR